MTNARVRLLAAAFATLSILAIGACSETDTAQTREQQNPPLGDNEIFSGIVAFNNNVLQQSTVEQGNTNAGAGVDGGVGPADPDVLAIANQQVTDHSDALNRLVGTSTINYTDGGFPATGGLGASAGLTLNANRLSFALNAQGAADNAALNTGVGTIEPVDCAYLANMSARHKDAVKLVKYLLADSNDGGATLSNGALKDELTAEQTTETAHLKKIKAVLAALTAAPAATPDGGMDTGGVCYVAPAP
jgi:hypothetical protein